MLEESIMLVKKMVRGAVLQLIRDNGGEIDKFGHVSGLPEKMEEVKNETIFSEDGRPVPFSEGVICQKRAGGVNCQFKDVGKVIPVLRVGDEVIIPGHICLLLAEAVPTRFGCDPDRECPSTCVNNTRTAWRQPSLSAVLARA
jgi:hypothetical protein